MKLSIIAVAISVALVGCGPSKVEAEQAKQIQKLQEDIDVLSKATLNMMEDQAKARLEQQKPTLPKLILTQDDEGYEGSKAEKHFEAFYDQCKGEADTYFVGNKGYLCSSYEITVDLIGQLKYGNFDQNLAKHQKSFDNYCKLGQGDLYSVTDKDGEHRFYCYNFSTAMEMIGDWQDDGI